MAAIERLKEKYLADQKILSQAEEVLKGQEVVPLERPNIVDVEICVSVAVVCGGDAVPNVTYVVWVGGWVGGLSRCCVVIAC